MAQSTLSEKEKKAILPRITQLDAHEFDNEITNILRHQLLKVSKYLKPGALNSLKEEINLLLNLIVFKYSVVDKNATFGQQLLSLKYEKVLTRRQIVLYALMNYILPYLKVKYEDSIARQQWTKVKKVMEIINIIIKGSNVINLIIFLMKGNYPTVCDHLLKLKFIPATKLNRNVGYNFMTRELLWHGFMELLYYGLPLINYKAIKRKFKNAIFKKKKTKKIHLSYSIETKCAICNDFPVNPCQISFICGHIACYYCIKSNKLEDDKFMCPSCNEINTFEQNFLIQ